MVVGPIREALTFDDVLLLPAKSDVLGYWKQDQVAIPGITAMRKGLTVRFVRRMKNTFERAIDLGVVAWWTWHPWSRMSFPWNRPRRHLFVPNGETPAFSRL